MRLQGKTALVTGGGRRLGRAIALALARDGADILLHVHASSGEDVVRDITDLGRQATVLTADLSSSAEAERLGHAALRVTGRVDILVNNAAVFFPTPLEDLTVDIWRMMLRTNLTAPFLLASVLGKAMRKQGSGKIIQLGDWSGMRPVPGYLPYCVAKSGIVALTQALAKAFAPHVHVNTVALGPILLPEHYGAETLGTLTNETPLRRVGQVSDVVRAVQFFAEDATFVTGSTYVVDGGWLAKVGSGSETSL